jgi:putative tryptophan/tyrosine transport system substrate-binding protein
MLPPFLGKAADDAAFATLGAWPPDTLFVGPEPYFYTRRGQLALQAARHAIPASYAIRDYAEAGGLMSYGKNIRIPIITSASTLVAS